MARNNTRITSVMMEIQSRIASRSYPPGTRLPSVRTQARTLQVSVSTVVEAYERLVANGSISSRPGSGFYVAGPVAPLALMQLVPRLDQEIDPLWISRQSLETDVSVLKPGCGWLPSQWLYETGVRRALRTLARGELQALTDYATPLGHPGLRHFLARRLAGLGIQGAADQIMLTDSATQALDLICRFLLEPGDSVLVDDPCYFNFHALLKAHRVKVVGVPYTPDGPDVEHFGKALQEHSPRLYITNSGLHNPTGATLSPMIAHRILKLAEGADIVIVEDDILSDFETSTAPRLAAFDGLSRVIHIGSFSKTISASLRCGYIAARRDWLENLVDLKIATAFGGGRLAAEIVLGALTDSGYRKHMDTLRSRLAEEMLKTIDRLGNLGITPWLVPRAGLYLWCQLPEGMEAAALARTCLEDGVILAPGNAFSPSLSAGRFLRFNVAQSNDKRIFDVMARALSAYKA